MPFKSMPFKSLFGHTNNDASSESSTSWVEEYLKELEEEDDYEDDEDDRDEDDLPYFFGNISGGSSDDNDPESLDAEEASYIWMSNGKDEDYSFGFTDEELEKA